MFGRILNTPLFPCGIYLFKVHNGNTRTMYKISSKLTTKTPEQRHWCRSGVFVINFEQIEHIVLVFSIVEIEQVNDVLVM